MPIACMTAPTGTLRRVAAGFTHIPAPSGATLEVSPPERGAGARRPSVLVEATCLLAQADFFASDRIAARLDGSLWRQDACCDQD